jgi:hypothetical protein
MQRHTTTVRMATESLYFAVPFPTPSTSQFTFAASFIVTHDNGLDVDASTK